MSMQDPLSDMLTRIRNAQMVGKTEVTMPSSKLKVKVAKLLEEEGYVSRHSLSNEPKPLLTIGLKYFKGKSVISEINRVSRPGLRHYVGKDNLPSVRSRLGVAVISTSKGIMSDRTARSAGIGGEVLCTVF